ncbi:MAG: DNA polymerase III subunit gamma/tau [Bacteroidales bacterium]|nr:DNA polymerase III subunit gamma/tau [Bacteroidales bacterium]
MSHYLVSARKYRPDTFETLIGQDNIARTLKNSILRGQLAHAYLFCGPRGVGKTSAARIFAKTINCSNPGPDMEPCGECESCVSFREGRSYCIHELDAASNNGVEDIKTLMEQVQIPPQVGRYSVYIIDEVHMLSQAAFNSFLKTLEEPPAHAIFILCTTEKHKIIPTILSRCQTYDFNRIGISDIVRNLRTIADKEGVTADDASLHIIAQKADGAMRDALTIFDQTVAFCGTDIKYEDVIRNLNVLDYEYSFRLTDAFLAKDYGTALLIFDEILSKGFNSLHFISALGSHLRDLLVSRTGGLESLLDLPDSLRERYREQASRCSVKFIYDALAVISQCEAGYRAATNQRLHIEFALMRIAFLGGVPAESPVAAVKEISRQARNDNPSVINSNNQAIEVPAQSVKDSAQVQSIQDTAQIQKQNRSIQDSAQIQDQNNSGSIANGADRNFASKGLGPYEMPLGSKIPAATQQDTKVSYKATQQDTIVPSEANQQLQINETASSAPEERKPRKRASGLSLSSLMSGEKEEESSEKADAVIVPGALPSAEEVQAKWTELAATYTAQPRLSGALATAKLDVLQEDGMLKVSFALVSKAQRDWIAEKKLRELEDRFSAMLGCQSLRLYPEVLPEEQQEKKIYMPVEKAQDLMRRNSEVNELVKDLALDIR